MICANCFIPEFWFEEPDKVGALMPESVVTDGEAKPKTLTYLATGFACAKKAEAMEGLSKDEIVKQTLAQLDEMFGGRDIGTLLTDSRNPLTSGQTSKINSANPASETLIDGMVIDWGKNPFIGGGYSSPCFGETSEMRELWSEPVDGKLYFAGEAFNSASIMTVHGAMETAHKVANKIIQSQQNASKL